MDAGMSEVLVSVADDRWHTTDLPGAENMIAAAVRAALKFRAASDLVCRRVEIGVRLTNDDDIRALNRDWRGQDKPTNVLAFALDEDAPPPEGDDEPGIPLGDIVVAFETCAREARDEGKPFADHLCHLVVHGTLHLLGYDHDVADVAERMESAEREILGGLGIPDPYADSVAA